MFRFRCLLRASLATAALLGCSAAGSAETRYALIVSGATGGQEYVAQYTGGRPNCPGHWSKG